jgi:chromosome segregation ATPase
MSNTSQGYANARSTITSASSSPRSQQSEGSTTIRRTLIEHGLRPVGSDDLTNSHSSTVTAITTINKQHQDEQRELQELNAKFAVYLDRVQYLENFNHRLTNDLKNLKQAWGSDAAQLHANYGPQLKALRDAIDDAIRNQGLRELQIKRHEYDLWQVQQQIATIDESDSNRLNLLKQELDATTLDIEQLRNQFEQGLTDLAKQQTTMENLLKELDSLKNELDNQQLERIMVENEVQTLKEHAAFQDAVYQAERAELTSLGKIFNYRRK